MFFQSVDVVSGSCFGRLYIVSGTLHVALYMSFCEIGRMNSDIVISRKLVLLLGKSIVLRNYSVILPMYVMLWGSREQFVPR
jgi:hypothetical protein